MITTLSNIRTPSRTLTPLQISLLPNMEDFLLFGVSDELVHAIPNRTIRVDQIGLDVLVLIL